MSCLSSIKDKKTRRKRTFSFSPNEEVSQKKSKQLKLENFILPANDPVSKSKPLLSALAHAEAPSISEADLSPDFSSKNCVKFSSPVLGDESKKLGKDAPSLHTQYTMDLESKNLEVAPMESKDLLINISSPEVPVLVGGNCGSLDKNMAVIPTDIAVSSPISTRARSSTPAPMKMRKEEGSGVLQLAAMIKTSNGATVLTPVGKLGSGDVY
ncbi:hypothetical protein lerEdw1_006551 [Lerista edwardsae]|nr:hypothetical protein lerEdw1_006551 [Lerista edwardsae]